MIRKKLVTRTKIAKLSGHDKRHFLTCDARHQKKPICDIAGLTKLGFHLIKVLIGSAPCALTGKFAKNNALIISKVWERGALATGFCKSKLVFCCLSGWGCSA